MKQKTQINKLLARELATRALDAPPAWAKYALGQDLWEMQGQILLSLRDHRRTAVKACHASGKSYVAASAVLWWLDKYEDGMVVITAPTWIQVKKVLWGEIHSALTASPLDWPTAMQAELIFSPNHYAIGRSTSHGVNVQGFHGGHVLFLVDEASGIPKDIWDGIDSISAGGDVRVLAIGNPIGVDSEFYQFFHRFRADWNTLTISAYDTPNIKGLSPEDIKQLDAKGLDNNVMPKLITRRYVREKLDNFGTDSPEYQMRCLLYTSPSPRDS